METPSVQVELEKLAALEQQTNARAFDPDAAMHLLCAIGGRPVQAGSMDKVAARFTEMPRHERVRLLTGKAIAGDDTAMGALQKNAPPWISDFAGVIGSKSAMKEVQACLLQEFDKKAQLDGDDIMSSLRPVVDSMPQMGGGDDIGDYILRQYQKKRYMAKAVRSYSQGKAVRPPVWWDKSSDEWYGHLDNQAKHMIMSELV